MNDLLYIISFRYLPGNFSLHAVRLVHVHGMDYQLCEFINLS